jgi:hypothetical protein
VAREREKKGRHGSDRMTPFLQGGMAERELGGVRWSWRVSDGARSRLGDAAVQNRGAGVANMWCLIHSTRWHGEI